MKIPGKLGKYVITKELGRGATGIVYLCHDPYQGRDVALKLYVDDKSQTEEKRKMRKRLFFNEAHMVGMLTHPSILPIYDAGEQDGQCYVVMEYVRGANPLSDFCKPENLLPIRKVVETAFKCARALEYAHRKGVIHRDIKPSNILLSVDNDIRIVDFGIAQNPVSELSTLSGLVGSPAYMAPEQVKEDRITNQVDIYSLGVVMYELLTGKRPFYGENLSRLVHQIINATPIPLHRLRADVPDLLEKIVAKAICKDSEKRYKNCTELSIDLTHAFNKLGKLQEEIAEQERFNIVKQLEFFSEFSYPEIWEVLNSSKWEVFDESDQVVAEGDLDDSFYIIVSGEVEVSKNGRVLGKLAEGDCFGEMGFMNNTERSAAVITKKGVSLMRVNSTLIEQASLKCQLQFHKVFLKSLIQRLSRTSDMAVKAHEEQSGG